ncbi:hypothetical protein [Mucilaginibacter sp.]|jgi:hypothetical protein
MIITYQHLNMTLKLCSIDLLNDIYRFKRHVKMQVRTICINYTN